MSTTHRSNPRSRSLAPRSTGSSTPDGPPRAAGAATIAALALLLLAGGCATTAPPEADAPFELSEDYTDGVVSYTVQRGDRLGDIALEFTGDMSLWKEIAASNGIDDPRSLRAGSVLRIPAALIPGYADELAARTSRTTKKEESVAARDTTDTRAAGAAVASGLAVRRTAPVELSPVDTNRRFELSPIDDDAVDGTAEKAADRIADDRGANATGQVDTGAPGPRLVKVIGSYTPRGIYAQPASYSKLLMRVAPGTLLELDGEVVGDWYRVVTTNGIGYLRDSDGRVVEEPGDEARTASTGATRG